MYFQNEKDQSMTNSKLRVFLFLKKKIAIQYALVALMIEEDILRLSENISQNFIGNLYLVPFFHLGSEHLGLSLARG